MHRFAGFTREAIRSQVINRCYRVLIAQWKQFIVEVMCCVFTSPWDIGNVVHITIQVVSDEVVWCSSTTAATWAFDDEWEALLAYVHCRTPGTGILYTITCIGYTINGNRRCPGTG